MGQNDLRHHADEMKLTKLFCIYSSLLLCGLVKSRFFVNRTAVSYLSKSQKSVLYPESLQAAFQAQSFVIPENERGESKKTKAGIKYVKDLTNKMIEKRDEKMHIPRYEIIV